MAINAVAAWEGTLEWVGEPNGGKTHQGNDWMSVEFTLKYQDSQMNDKEILFSAFGVDRVNKLMSIPKGTTLRVVWWPECNQAKNSDRRFAKNSVINISIVQPQSGIQHAPQPAPQQPITAAQAMYDRLGMTPTPNGGYAYPQQPTPPQMQPPMPMAQPQAQEDLPF